MTIGFIGQGWIGRNYADDFEKRGFDVVRYGLEPEYSENLELLEQCSIVFVAVPTPTTAAAGFDLSIVRSVLALVAKHSTVVIKSTMLPGSTELLQSDFPWLYIFHSPEFLTEATAAHDASHPKRNIVGTPKMDPEWLDRTRTIHGILPWAPFTATLPSAAAELVKYAGNALLFTKVVFVNLLYDLAQQLGLEWHQIAGCLAADPRLGWTHLEPVHASGRGAGGHCFIKDFSALSDFYCAHVGDSGGMRVLFALAEKNIALLQESGKDLDILKGVY